MCRFWGFLGWLPPHGWGGPIRRQAGLGPALRRTWLKLLCGTFCMEISRTPLGLCHVSLCLLFCSLFLCLEVISHCLMGRFVDAPSYILAPLRQ